MDLYRYFYPHYSPRLRNVPLRLEELSELKLAAEELRKALERAEIRSETAPTPPIRKDHFSEILVAINYVADSLATLEKAHPGDGDKVLEDLLNERKKLPGWEKWAELLQQRLNSVVNDFR